jgi:hypothetical protein
MFSAHYKLLKLLILQSARRYCNSSSKKKASKYINRMRRKMQFCELGFLYLQGTLWRLICVWTVDKQHNAHLDILSTYRYDPLDAFQY